ncbi:two-component regulator propeller domain-containing protein [Mariniphaga sp.]|uniref:hybrid sensor histidine kinase/response regulator transcription factor n=1 Tax=Mariniphaga sp. TaxID=1954475 RepID=UPI003569D191
MQLFRSAWIKKLILVFFCISIVFGDAKAFSSELTFDIFTQEDGLPNNQIQCIYQDTRGWIWIGTSQGLSRFDGYSFVNFLPNTDDSTSLKGNLVRVIKEDRKGNLLIGTENGGLNVFNRELERFSHPLKNSGDLKFRDISVNDIVEDGNGNFYIGTNINILLFDSLGRISPLIPDMPQAQSFEGSFVRNLEFDQNGILWIGTNNGLFTFNPETNLIEPFQLPFQPNQNKQIWEIFLDDDGAIWVGTYTAGLFIISPEDHSLTQVLLTPDVNRNETVRSVSKGVFGEFWIGTRGGLYSYSKSRGVTGFYRHDERDPRSISNNSILSVFDDARGETWIGTRGGLNLLAKSKQVFHHFSALPGDNNYLNSNIIYAFWIDDDGKIWIGTEDGGVNIFDPETGKYEYLTADENNLNSISQNCIKAFLDDGHGNLWIGTYLGGIDVINLKTRKISHFKHEPGKPGSLSDNRVWDFCLDKYNDIWVATSKGVDRYNRQTNSFEHFSLLNGENQVSWIEPDSNGNLWMGGLDEVIVFNQEENVVTRFPEHSHTMFEDSGNRIWIATFDKGIALYSPDDGPIKYYGEKDGLANNHTLSILEDQNNQLWISTNNGLSMFNTEKEYFRNFSSQDGLSNNQFCYRAGYKTQSGQMLFGSISGFNLFNPEEIILEETNVPLVFTDFKIFNKSVAIGEGKKPVLQKSISETEHLVLNYDQNMFTIEFAALNFVNSDKNMYLYMLEGFNRNWNEPGTNRSATFTNLNPGNYLLRIKRVVPGFADTGNELQLKITIMPPFWKTTWFLSLLFIFIIFMIYSLLKFFVNREKIKNQLVMERVNARKLHELDMMKLKFFTNISHEIRTPLTLIIGPLEKILNQDLPKSEIKENLKLVNRNAKNLEKLISQLLDFRKLEAGNLKLDLVEGDIVEFTRNIVNSFNDLALEKQVKLRFNTLKKQLFTSFDPDKIEKVLNNLLSNAFKFTEPGGSVSVNLSLIFDTEDDDFSASEKEKQFVEIVVKDTGRGIPSENLKKIFHRFFQSDDEAKDSGTGIGLSLVKELVSIHKGNIFVASKPGKGTKFTIRIPYIQAFIKTVAEDKNEPVNTEKPASLLNNAPIQPAENLHSKIMLVVEDNADVRQFIASHFNSTFQIIEARNGEEGWEKALEHIPNIIISDVIMPNMNGYELCERVKNDERTSHIPVLLLTALHSKEHEIKGITTGADDYITKPFDLSVLQAKVENVLSIRESLKEKFSRNVVLEPTNVEITSPDERFLQKAIQVVEENISDCDLDIETFSEKVGVSRMQLYRKLHALTDMTVKEFIRHIRLKRATQMLVQNKMNISEVAYEVGFKDLSHFRKCFKREYGMSATEYIANSKSKEADIKI